MTKETAKEILGLLDEGGEIDKEGYISGCTIWTATIDEIRKRDVLIFFDDIKGQMCITDWPENMDEEPETTMAFRGFEKEEIELKITDDGLKNSEHDHLEFWCEGKKLGMMHICKYGVYVWPEDKEHKHVRF